jgi:hypothetical protein
VLAQERPAKPRAGGERSAPPAPRPDHHGTRTAPQRAAAAHTRPAGEATGSGAPKPPPRRRAAWHPLRAARPRSPDRALDRRGSGARNRDLRPDTEARTAPARRTGRRQARRSAAAPLLVTPRPRPQRGRIRPTRRLRTDPRLLRTNDPLPPRPQRRQTTQPSAAAT